MEKRPVSGEYEEKSDAELVRLTLDGDTKSFPVLIDRYWRMVFSLAYKNCRNVTDSEDVTQESFLAALSSLPKLKDPSKFSSWLYGLTLNTGRSFLRKKTRTPSLPEPMYEETADDPTALQTMSMGEREEALHKAVQSLKPIYRSVVELRFFEDMSCEDIAKKLDEPSGTIRSRLCRANEMLRKKLKKYY